MPDIKFHPIIFFSWLKRACCCLVLTLAMISSTRAEPNFVVIMADDMNADEIAYMPNLNKYLKDKGITFSNFFASTPLCCPSRTTFLTGQYSHNTGIHDNGGSNGGFEAFKALGLEQNTIATRLQDAGYRTGLMGKYLNYYSGKLDADGVAYIPPGWDEWHVFVSGISYFSFNINSNGQIDHFGKENGEYSTDYLTKLAVNFIDESTTDVRPFFLFLTPTAPHKPYSPALEHRLSYLDAETNKTDAFNEQDISDKPTWVGELEPITQEQIDTLDAEFILRMQMLLSLDDMIGDVIQTLNATNKMKDTYLIFTADHGWHQGEHRLFNTKGTPYEETIKIPFIMRGPNVPQAAIRDQLISNIDFYNTILDLGLKRSVKNVDGRSFKPLIRDAAAAFRSKLLIEYLGDVKTNGFRLPIPRFRGMRMEDSIFIHYFEVDEFEYYDLSNDPYQLNNIYNTLDPITVQGFLDDLNALQDCKASSCRQAD